MGYRKKRMALINADIQISNLYGSKTLDLTIPKLDYSIVSFS